MALVTLTRYIYMENGDGTPSGKHIEIPVAVNSDNVSWLGWETRDDVNRVYRCIIRTVDGGTDIIVNGILDDIIERLGGEA